MPILEAREEEEILYKSALHQPRIFTLLQQFFAMANAQFSCIYVHTFFFSIDLDKIREVPFTMKKKHL